MVVMEIKYKIYMIPLSLPITLTYLKALLEPTVHALLPVIDGHPALLVHLAADQAGVVTPPHTPPEESAAGLTANTSIVRMAPSLQEEIYL